VRKRPGKGEWQRAWRAGAGSWCTKERHPPYSASRSSDRRPPDPHSFLLSTWLAAAISGMGKPPMWGAIDVGGDRRDVANQVLCLDRRQVVRGEGRIVGRYERVVPSSLTVTCSFRPAQCIDRLYPLGDSLPGASCPRTSARRSPSGREGCGAGLPGSLVREATADADVGNAMGGIAQPGDCTSQDRVLGIAGPGRPGFVVLVRQ
jgi:hypothetical protein